MPFEKDITTDEEIKKSYWWITHLIIIKKKIVEAIIGGLIIWWLIILIVAILIFVIQREQYASLGATLRDQTAVYSIPSPPSDVVISDVGMLPGSGQSFDLYASLQNTNQDWWLNFTYQFFVDGKPMEERSSFIFPGEQKYVLFLAQTLQNSIQADLKIISTKWHHITKTDRRLLAQRHRFSVSDIQYTSSDQTGAGFAIPVSSVRFTVKNSSPFTFPEINVSIIAKQDNTIVAVAQTPLYNIKPEESRTRTVQWFHSFTQPNSFDIRPTINVLDNVGSL